MPKSKNWPYPLPVGTHVVASVRKLDLQTDAQIVGTIVRHLKRSPKGITPATVSYAIKAKDGGLVEALAGRTIPIDTSTPEGLEQWLNALEENTTDSADLPGTELADAYQNQHWNLQSSGPTTPSITVDWTSGGSGGGGGGIAYSRIYPTNEVRFTNNTTISDI